MVSWSHEAGSGTAAATPAISKTVPKAALGPPLVSPKRLPLASSATPPVGSVPPSPLLRSIEASVVMVVEPDASSKTEPRPLTPPKLVAPKRSPFASSVRPLAPSCCGLPTNEASVVMVFEPWAISKIVAGPLLPFGNMLNWVVPKMFPWASSVRPVTGNSPLKLLNEANVVMVFVPLAISKTVPRLEAPPPSVVPKRLPFESMVTPACGPPPLVPLNEASVVAVFEPLAISKTMPLPLAPPDVVVPKRLPLASSTTPPVRFARVLNVASVVRALLPLASSKTLPPSADELGTAVPKKLPLESSVTECRSPLPLFGASVEIVLDPWAISKTDPLPNPPTGGRAEDVALGVERQAANRAPAVTAVEHGDGDEVGGASIGASGAGRPGRQASPRMRSAGPDDFEAGE